MYRLNRMINLSGILGVINICSHLLIPNIFVKIFMGTFNILMIKTPYACLLNSIIHIIYDPSWRGLVFALMWLIDSQNFVIGELPEQYRNEVERIVNESKELKPDNSEIFWTSVFADNGKTTNIQYSADLHNYISNLRWRIVEFWFKRINGFGTLINPANSVEQDWHIDYTWSYTSIFIPIENCNSSNMTQIIVSSLFWGYFYKTRNLIEKNIPRLTATVFKPNKWSMLLLPPSVFHRGVKNNSTVDRTLFWISYQSKNDPIEKEKAVQDFTKKSIDL